VAGYVAEPSQSPLILALDHPSRGEDVNNDCKLNASPMFRSLADGLPTRH
jgi:hypothetical protein